MDQQYTRAYFDSEHKRADTTRRFTASTPGIKRDGLDLDPQGFSLENYNRNPVFLWAHDSWGARPPIGRAAVTISADRLIADVTFDEKDDFAMKIMSKYDRGFLNAVSISWGVINGGTEDRKLDLLEISGVPVPADPDALMERTRSAYTHVHEWLTELLTEPSIDYPISGALPPHAATAAEERATVSNGRSSCAWVDDIAQRYLLPHHDSEGYVVWAGVGESMARLFLNAAQIPNDDFEGVYKHLKRHYDQLGRVPPEYMEPSYLRSLTPAKIKGLFLYEEWRSIPDGDLPTEGPTEWTPTPEEIALLKKALDNVDQLLGELGQEETTDDNSLSDDQMQHILESLDGILEETTNNE